MKQWNALLALASGAFTRPGCALFHGIATAWILCPARRTLCGMLRLLGPDNRRCHDAYHRLFRAARWRMAELWAPLVKVLLQRLCPTGRIELVGDDTLARKTGRKVEGAGIFRDPVLSTKNRPVFLLGLNVVVLAIRSQPPWGGEPLALPVNVRLYRKGGPSHTDLMADMVRELAAWLPERTFHLTVDGAYASLARAELPRTHLTSRIRRDAALFDLPPPRRPGQRGRPRKRGNRLPALPDIARRIELWTLCCVDCRGRSVDRFVYTQLVLWYAVCGPRPVRLAICRDPKGVEPDDYFFTTDPDAKGYQIVDRYCGRWSVEDTFRSAKQFLGAAQPQCWRASGPERALATAFWLYSAVWLWYLQVHGTKPTWTPVPWYPSKVAPSFPDALAALRRCLWHERIFIGSRPRPLSAQMSEALVDALARAA
jgi:hypothetical protein